MAKVTLRVSLKCVYNTVGRDRGGDAVSDQSDVKHRGKKHVNTLSPQEGRYVPTAHRASSFALQVYSVQKTIVLGQALRLISAKII